MEEHFPPISSMGKNIFGLVDVHSPKLIISNTNQILEKHIIHWQVFCYHSEAEPKEMLLQLFLAPLHSPIRQYADSRRNPHPSTSPTLHPVIGLAREKNLLQRIYQKQLRSFIVESASVKYIAMLPWTKGTGYMETSILHKMEARFSEKSQELLPY